MIDFYLFGSLLNLTYTSSNITYQTNLYIFKALTILENFLLTDFKYMIDKDKILTDIELNKI